MENQQEVYNLAKAALEYLNSLAEEDLMPLVQDKLDSQPIIPEHLAGVVALLQDTADIMLEQYYDYMAEVKKTTVKSDIQVDE